MDLLKKVFDFCIDYDEIFLSGWILTELKTKLEYKFHVPENEINNLLGFFRRIANIVEPKGTLYKNSRDVKDDPILLLANYVGADLILTGDKDLLDLLNYKNIKIINPRTYYKLFCQN